LSQSQSDERELIFTRLFARAKQFRPARLHEPRPANKRGSTKPTHHFLHDAAIFFRGVIHPDALRKINACSVIDRHFTELL
jgi:hypothetical protein